jgi:hypothetical protein
VFHSVLHESQTSSLLWDLKKKKNSIGWLVLTPVKYIKFKFHFPIIRFGSTQSERGLQAQEQSKRARIYKLSFKRYKERD